MALANHILIHIHTFDFLHNDTQTWSKKVKNKRYDTQLAFIAIVVYTTESISIVRFH